jgi:mRNA interferase HicA
MKRSTLLQHLRKHGCTLKREGASHSLWTNPTNGAHVQPALQRDAAAKMDAILSRS